MREIKFRAWDKNLNKWIDEGITFNSTKPTDGQLSLSLDGHLRVSYSDCYPHEEDEDGRLIGECSHFLINSEYESKHPCHTKPAYKRQYVLMQFTGLLDKNGKEIYEGDILCFSPTYGTYSIMAGVPYSKEKHISQIIWKKMGFGLENEPDFRIIKWSDVEVIGNIYENPELLIKHNK